MGDEDEAMPFEGFLARLWSRAPSINPEELLNWPFDLVMKFRRYEQLANEVQQEMSKARRQQ